MTVALAVESLAVEVDGFALLRDASLQVATGEVLALVGPSGSGKTTILRALTGFVTPTRGVVRISGALASAPGRVHIPPEARNLAMVFQDLALWPHLTVHGNLVFGLEARGIPRDERERRIEELLAHVGLLGKIKCYPHQLSGGERQRVAIARALVQKPVAVLLDEPLSNLDVQLKRELLELFRVLLRERQMTALYVTHDPREAAALGDRVAVLEAGRIVQQGTLEEIRDAPASEFVSRLLEELGFRECC